MRATILLCDNAQAVNGKLYILGASWTLTGPEPVTMGIALQILVPWDEANRRHRFRLRLLTLDGTLAGWPSPVGPQNLDLSGEFEAGRAVGLRPGSELPAVVALNLAGLPLTPGGYEFRLSINDTEDPNWRAVFDVRSPQSPTVYRPTPPPPPI